MNINWWNIKSYNGSQNNSFEELVCQLARNENLPNKKSFYRLGTPDGGVEAYCTNDVGEEYGWQAKYFNTMGKSQWDQLENSFKTAFDKHPNLTKYYICIPLDRSDPRIPNENWFMDKWNSYEKKMEEFAKKYGRNITFEYWGSSELIDKLSLDINCGKYRFWFNVEEFSDEWIIEQSNNTIDALENRYTPELNFELEIAEIFNAIAFDDKFKNKFKNNIHELLLSIDKCVRFLNDTSLEKYKSQIKNFAERIKNKYEECHLSPTEKINYDLFQKQLRELQSSISETESEIDQLKEKEFEVTDKEGNKIKTKDKNRFNYQLNLLRSLLKTTYSFDDFINSTIAKLSNNPTLFLKGEAGSGKSHLLADITNKRIQENKLTLFLVGDFFVTDENPWAQLFKNILRINCSENEFLGGLNSRAEAQGSRILIIIDAINEGKGIYFWLDHIKSFTRKIEKYEFLGLVFSYRTSYEKLLIPQSILHDKSINMITHHGFSQKEDEAIKLFFNYYKIEYPSTPLLHPEFSNPLFLKLFCLGLSKAGFNKIPKGFTGISQIINFFINSINANLASPKRLDFPNEINLVKKTIEIFIEQSIQKDQNFLDYEEAYTLFETELKKISNKSKLLENLISEGIFNKNVHYLSAGNSKEVIYLSYQRFEDHLIASLLLNRNLDKSDPKQSFIKEGKLFHLIKDESECYKNKGLIEAFSIQIPELTGYEFYELAETCSSYFAVIDSFIESLIWRQPNTIKDNSKDYINKFIIPNEEIFHKFLDIIFLIGSNPEHIFNANYLHNYLNNYSMADRDAWWLPYTQNNYLYDASIKRLIQWSFSSNDKSFISEDSKILISKLLGWLLASSNRYLRDSVTKAIISLLSNEVHLVIELLKNFKNVNDPYITERLYAVAYGCVLRSSETKHLDELCTYVYETIFNQEEVFPNILLRDYARGIIEYSNKSGIKLDIDINKIRPPYKSSFPTNFSTNDEIDKKYKFDYEDHNFKDHHWAQDYILSSMTTEYGRGIARYGDFGRYTFESALKNWDGIKPELLSNWAIDRIFEMGYDVNKHGEFDRSQGSGRSAGHNERIGKKYQWIAFYEILARVSDNFRLKDPAAWSDKEFINYDGPWKPYVRDIDPSTLLIKTKAERFKTLSKNWWISIFPENWDRDIDIWLKSIDDLPDPKFYLRSLDPQNVEWFNLVLFPSWEEPGPIGIDKSEHPHKELLYEMRCFLIPQSDLNKIKNNINRSLFSKFDSYRNKYEIYHREYFWSPAYKFFNKRYYSGDFVQRIEINDKTKESIRIIIPVEYYLWEEEYDCSKEDVLSYYMPTTYLYHKMKMSFAKPDGLLNNSKGELVCYDPSIYNNSLQCLLIRGSDFSEFLYRNDLTAIWLFAGEKRINSGFADTKYLDRLELRGLYYLDGKEIKGAYNHNYIKHNAI